MEFETLCIHPGGPRHDTAGAVSVPIFQSATFVHPGVGRSTGYDYSRLQNPTREVLERQLAQLEGGLSALAFSSGMAAMTACMELFAPGDHFLASDDLYGGSYRLFDHLTAAKGMEFDLVNTSDPAAVEAALRPETKAILVETPTNPMMQVTDIARMAQICRGRDLLLLVDNTFLTPYYQKPLGLGADIVIHSGTKYLGGHNDTLAGFLVTGDAALSERLRFIYKTTGGCLAPFDSWLLLRGLKTLCLRMDRQQATAMALAQWLQTREGVGAVHYVGLPHHPGYEISRRQATGFGGMISFEVDSEARALRILERVRVLQYA
ncbi:MAG: aminotransferase class I/II-fold pyridoxal phosphate-dependent enzyme, partial [Clostridiales bacterium]|nr:aminotransferase class I/II-fold pyridoxal phosphate-dependent enzyme [Clostridiales bacterium]